MVMTHKSVAKSKKKVLNVQPKEDDPRRLHMTKAEAVADNEKRKAIKAKTDAYRKKLEEGGSAIDDDKDVDSGGSQGPISGKEMTSDEIKIAELEKELDSAKGPGSKAKKEKIQAQIDALKSGS